MFNLSLSKTHTHTLPFVLRPRQLHSHVTALNVCVRFCFSRSASSSKFKPNLTSQTQTWTVGAVVSQACINVNQFGAAVHRSMGFSFPTGLFCSLPWLVWFNRKKHLSCVYKKSGGGCKGDGCVTVFPREILTLIELKQITSNEETGSYFPITPTKTNHTRWLICKAPSATVFGLTGCAGAEVCECIGMFQKNGAFL